MSNIKITLNHKITQKAEKAGAERESVTSLNPLEEIIYDDPIPDDLEPLFQKIREAAEKAKKSLGPFNDK